MVFVNRTGNAPLDVESARKFFLYEKSTGRLFRKLSYGRYKETATATTRGHRVFGYNGRQYRATYLIWLLEYRRPPNGDVDHIDRNPANDQLSNLRECSRSQNMGNAKLSKRNKSGVKGVLWDKQRQKWAAYIRRGGKNVNLGRFDKIEQATEAYLRAAVETFGWFASDETV